MVPVNHPAQMNSNPNCRSFASGIRCPAGCHSSLGNASCVPALKPCILSNGMRCFSAADRPDRHRSAVAEHSHIECNCSACADTAHYANDSFACCVFVRKRRAEHRIQCVFPLGEDVQPLHGHTSSPPQTWDFAVICAHVGAHAMLHSDIACAPAPGARLRAFRPEYQEKCRTRQFPLDNSRNLRIQSVYTVIATPPETSRISRKAAG